MTKTSFKRAALLITGQAAALGALLVNSSFPTLNLPPQSLKMGPELSSLAFFGLLGCSAYCGIKLYGTPDLFEQEKINNKILPALSAPALAFLFGGIAASVFPLATTLVDKLYVATFASLSAYSTFQAFRSSYRVCKTPEPPTTKTPPSGRASPTI